jgi:hypothetical protein
MGLPCLIHKTSLLKSVGYDIYSDIYKRHVYVFVSSVVSFFEVLQQKFKIIFLYHISLTSHRF